MNMQYLSYFVELAHSGSYTSAAKKIVCNSAKSYLRN